MKNINRLIVFGSRAFLDYEKFSDLDLAIDAPTINKLEFLLLKEYVTYDLRTILQISLVHYNTNPHNLKTKIRETGKVIYER